MRNVDPHVPSAIHMTSIPSAHVNRIHLSARQWGADVTNGEKINPVSDSGVHIRAYACDATK